MNRRSRSRVVAEISLTVCLLLLAVAGGAGCVSVQKTGSEAAQAAPPGEPPREASVVFSSSPAHGEVWIDDAFVGSCPLSYRLEAGVHRIEIRLPGFQPWVRDLHVKADVATNVHALLELAPQGSGS